MKFEIRKQYQNSDGVFTCVKRSAETVWFRDGKGNVLERPIFISPRTGEESAETYHYFLSPSMTPESMKDLTACLAFGD